MTLTKHTPARRIAAGSVLAVFAAAMMTAGVLAPAWAQESQPAPDGSQSAWIKVCETEAQTEKEVCVVTQEIRDQNGGFLASAGVRTYAETPNNVALIFGFPLGMLLQPGVRYQIDQNEQKSGAYGICLPTGCFAEVKAEPADIDAMKKGNQLVLLAISGRGETVSFPLSLIGFTKTFEGPPIDPQVLAESQRKLEAEIKRRAEARRKELLEQQEQQGGEAASQ